MKEKVLEIKPGDLVRVHWKVKGKSEVFEGIVIAKKHGKEPGATITIRREFSGIGVEKIFPLNSPLLEKIEILKRNKVKRAKLYYLRKKK